jgi:hypothetical protein
MQSIKNEEKKKKKFKKEKIKKICGEGKIYNGVHSHGARDLNILLGEKKI